MNQETKYMTVIVEDFPIGKKIYYFYMPIIQGLVIGNVITDKNWKQYRVIQGKTQLSFADIDGKKYQLFPLL